jgi:putative endonuclease
MEKQYFVYIMTNVSNTVLYTGVTSDLKKRVFEHRNQQRDGFTCRYNIIKLVYYEVFAESFPAIAREKQIKGGTRNKKIELINETNGTWRDLYDEI